VLCGVERINRIVVSKTRDEYGKWGEESLVTDK
jgi:hypothetical protein